ncbi:MAG TPA: hypothetical protein VKR61_20700 [Bryobacteraceae bacterium]|nr:hypothetical protein [Bryobacteraceae bacterium]
MPKYSKQDTEILEAALVGFERKRTEIEEKIADLRGRIGGQPAASDGIPAAAGKRRKLSAGARRRIALAQKKRWAAFKSGHATVATPKAKKPKRVLSAAGRARIIAATKKRWAAFRKSKAGK